MRTRPPSIRVDGSTLTVRIDLVVEEGIEWPAVEVTLPRRSVDRLDPTATPALPLLAAVAAAQGRTVTVEGPVDGRAVDAADALAHRLAERWGRGAAAVRSEAPHTAPPIPGGEDVGLLFDRSIDAWAALLVAGRGAGTAGPGSDLAAATTTDDDRRLAVTHLIVVADADPSPASTAARAGHRSVADELELELVEPTTTAAAVLAAVNAPAEAGVLAHVSAALAAGAGLRRIVLPDPAGAELVAGLPSRPALVGAPARPLVERMAAVVADPLARATLQVCWEGETTGNCGRCPRCQATMSALLLAGDPAPSEGFDHPLDPALVRTLVLQDLRTEVVDTLIAGLPPEHEVLRRAWIDARAIDRDEAAPPRWGDWDVPGLAGPGVPQRAATALRAATGTADVPATRPLGWRSGTVPLRPALADHPLIRARAATGPSRAQAWAVVEHHIRADDQDGEQAALALRCLDAHGPGLVYLPGILWAPQQPPALGPDAVARLLGSARARLWWRPSGDLEPLRVVESIEHGCLPLQAMPPGAADELRADLPPALAPLVVAEDELGRLDLSPEAVSRRLGPALDLLLAGAAEHDLAGVLRG